MADLVADLAAQAGSLASDERSRLAELLLESLHEPSLFALPHLGSVRSTHTCGPSRSSISGALAEQAAK
jgi:hypothetical protein